ncbi:MAG TPA: molybdopterin-binding protein [Limnochordia bacterium]|nr:molybdopterin-binding protein [Limnochordia bacterium]
MKEIRTVDACGAILCHDITRIIPGELEERAFRKGHVVTAADIPELLKLGKDHLFVWESERGRIHENEAAQRIAAAVAGPGIEHDEPNQGKVELTAAHDGLFTVDTTRLRAINAIEQVTVITGRTRKGVHKGGLLAGTRVIPLVIDEAKIEAVEQIAGGDPLLSVRPYRPHKVGMVTTGNEVFYGRIQDGFGPVLKEKFAAYGSELHAVRTAPDDQELIVQALREVREAGCDFIVATGGMSVDPDDRTPGAIARAGAEIISYGVPVLPGNMLLIAEWDGIPLLGLPGCVMFKHTTSLDWVLPILLAGERITRDDVIDLAHGGLMDACC